MAAGDELIVRRTSAPVTLIDRDMGTGDAWSLVHAANEAWEKGDHGWVSLDG